ncbi:glutamate cyclase domain-containing protein [Pseudonocardia acaciae]|uniref:glutamate cyclase domain-containing protein n=1 Tax=Pseudonocardia acaciae TaxID=551276 RepID=UPI0009FFF246|nr:glutamate cyclase domain-containing protein [Pseudonocardia acaciae]
MEARVLDEVGRQLDHLMSLDTSGKGVVPPLYRAATSGAAEPLSTGAARMLAERVEPGDVVGIITGFPSRSFLLEGVTETDGPVGAALLARVLEEALGVVPVIITERRVAHFCALCATAAGLLVTDAERALRSKRGPHHAACTAVVDVPTEHDAARARAAELFDTLAPAALVAVEQPSVGADGLAHTAAGRAITDHLLAKMDHLFTEAARRGVPRIGIGDNGNEMGMASIRDAVHASGPLGPTICAGSDCDALLVAGNSNWGAYALAAAVEATAAGRCEVLPRVDIEAIHRRCAEAGAIDGISQRPEPKSDGTPIELNRGVLALMAWVVNVAAAKG